jgi:hypothetical protein
MRIEQPIGNCRRGHGRIVALALEKSDGLALFRHHEETVGLWDLRHMPGTVLFCSFKPFSPATLKIETVFSFSQTFLSHHSG